MTEVTTAKPDEVKEVDSKKNNIVLQVASILLFGLNLAVSVVMMLLPLNKLYGKFQLHPEKVLWILFAFSLGFSGLLFALGVRKSGSSKYSTYSGATYLVLGLLCAVEIFILAANRTAGTPIIPRSLFWLLGIFTISGAIFVYLPERAKRRKEEEEKRTAEEERLRQRRKGPTVLRFKARRYHIYENRLSVYTD